MVYTLQNGALPRPPRTCTHVPRTHVHVHIYVYIEEVGHRFSIGHA